MWFVLCACCSYSKAFSNNCSYEIADVEERDTGTVPSGAWISVPVREEIIRDRASADRSASAACSSIKKCYKLASSRPLEAA